MTKTNRGESLARKIFTWILRVSDGAAWLILPICLVVLISVALSAARVGILLEWDSDFFLLGSKLTASSFGDIQWHLFGIMLMLTLSGTLASDRHVRVDFVRQHMTDTQKAAFDLFGHLVFLMPLCIVMIYHGYDFTFRAYLMDDGSDYDGLYDRFFLKSFIPIGFIMLFAVGINLSLRCLKILLRSKRDRSNV